MVATSMGQLLAAFAYASDLAFGLQLEDCMKSCAVATRIAQEMDLDASDVETVYYTALLKDAGCTSWTSELAKSWQTDEIVARREFWIFTDQSNPAGIENWFRTFVAADQPPDIRERRYEEVVRDLPQLVFDAITNTAEVAGRIARRLGMSDKVQFATQHLFEQWDGNGAPGGLSGDQIPVASRVVLPTFIAVPVHRVSGREAAVAALKKYSGVTFDPTVIDAYERLSQRDDFWHEIEAPGVTERVLAMEPQSGSSVGDSALDEIALAFADFIDLKSRFAAAHSRRVAAVAEQIARLMGSAPEAAVQIRRAALMHDLGLVAIPSFCLEKPEEQLSETEKENYRLHPYHGERILRRLPVTTPYAEMVGNHQERMDGSGYFRGLRGENASLGARIIAVADRLDELTHDSPGRAGVSVEAAVRDLENDPGFDQRVVDTMKTALGMISSRVEAPLPAGLSKRELEVLRLASRGLTRAQIGLDLGISENTVRHHLQHVYDKTGTTTRVGATLFAVEHGLLD